jgi:hypothetical protein
VPTAAPHPDRYDVALATLAMLTRNTYPSTISVEDLEAALGAVYAASLLDDSLTRDFRPALCRTSVVEVTAYLQEKYLVTRTLDLTAIGHRRLTQHPSVRARVNAALSLPLRPYTA